MYFQGLPHCRMYYFFIDANWQITFHQVEVLCFVSHLSGSGRLVCFCSWQLWVHCYECPHTGFCVDMCFLFSWLGEDGRENGGSIFTFFEELPNCFPWQLHHFISRLRQSSNLSTSLSAFVTRHLSNFSPSEWGIKLYLIVGLFHFAFMSRGLEHLTMCCWSFVCLWENTYSLPLPLLKLSCLYFYY
jgi:hypothetical protein